MPVSVFDHLTRQTASHLITFYQKRLSPYKGFACAHRVLHGGESCSQYTKRLILERGLFGARPFVRRRFQACKAANDSLKIRRDHPKRRSTQQTSATYTESYGSLQLATPDPHPVFRMEGGISPASDSNPLDEPPLNPPPLDPTKNKTTKNAVNTGQEQSCSSDSSSLCDGLDCADAACVGAECLPEFEFQELSCGELSCDLGDCSALDCSSLDCGALDCGSCDFGSCG